MRVVFFLNVLTLSLADPTGAQTGPGSLDLEFNVIDLVGVTFNQTAIFAAQLHFTANEVVQSDGRPGPGLMEGSAFF